MLTNELFYSILDIGEHMLISGAEINRVEDSIGRICTAYQAKRVDVFTSTSSMVVSVYLQSGQTLTQSRRILKYATNLNKLHKLNNLSRYICKHTPASSYISDELNTINKDKTYAPLIQYMSYALIASSFTIFFGGGLADAAVSAAIGMLLKLLITFVQKVDQNVVLVNMICSFTVGMLAVFAVRWGVGNCLEKIIIGNIMLLIPGVALTNSVRDMMNGDNMSGIVRLSEAILLALSVAAGFGIAVVFFGGILK